MEENYPFLERVRAAIDAINRPEITLKWLADEIGRTPRWIYGVTDFRKLEFGLVEAISAALNFNFEEDYNNWLKQQGLPGLFIVNEPAGVYQVKQKKVRLNLTLTANEIDAEENVGKLYRAIREFSTEHGFEVTKNETVFL